MIYDDADDPESMTLIPADAHVMRDGPVVWIKFSNEDDAIIFCEIIREMARVD